MNHDADPGRHTGDISISPPAPDKRRELDILCTGTIWGCRFADPSLELPLDWNQRLKSEPVQALRSSNCPWGKHGCDPDYCECKQRRV